MVLMIERGLRGGIAQCSERIFLSNNKYMGEQCNQNKESVFIQQIDANHRRVHQEKVGRVCTCTSCVMKRPLLQARTNFCKTNLNSHNYLLIKL